MIIIIKVNILRKIDEETQTQNFAHSLYFKYVEIRTLEEFKLIDFFYQFSLYKII